MENPPRKRRWLRWFLLLVVLPVALVATFYLVENYRGRRAWERYCAEAKSRGVKLYLNDFLQPDIPDEENYAAVPVIREMFAATGRTNDSSQTFKLPSKFNTKHPNGRSMRSGKRADLAEWQAFFLAEKYLDATTDNPARDVLLALQKYEPALQQLRDASSRPKCKFPTRWEDGFAVQLPHLRELLDATRLFALRINSHFVLAETDAALAEALQVLRIDEALATEPALLAGLVRYATLMRLTEEIWDAMAGGLLREQALRVVDASFSRLDLLRDMQFINESERGFTNQALEAAIRGVGNQTYKDLFGAVLDGTGYSKTIAFIPKGWAYDCLVMHNRCHDDCTMRYDPARGFVPEPMDAEAWLEQELQSRLWKQVPPLKRFKYSLLYLITGVSSAAGKRQLEAHTRVQHVRLACALELFRRANGRFPDTLDSLVPGSIAAVPKDICDGKPMRYRLNADGGYDLWSIGENRIDDGGVVPKNKSAEQLDWLWHMPSPAR